VLAHAPTRGVQVGHDFLKSGDEHHAVGALSLLEL
jgi:hypothetical protein